MNDPTLDEGHDGSLTRIVVNYHATVRRLVTAAQQPGFTAADWALLGEFVAIDDFECIGTWMEVMNW